ncbi:spindle and kinetochore-associated protein 2 [Protopterus annectens]|uniref:spindle and kinetochore-associated protein 2 n=1 Tax=Protopterus annectens TaxID=7888 RepID=UPI001CFB9785|nr:spindle and kinetochore-associated protein 2 [Protopterus annectens]
MTTAVLCRPAAAFTGLLEECKLFNMETTVNKLEAMFEKAEADLDYIKQKLEFEIVRNLPDEGKRKENPIMILEQLNVIKSRHKALCKQMEKISAEQKECTEVIRSTLSSTEKMLQDLNQLSCLEASPLSDQEQEAARLMNCQSLIAEDHNEVNSEPAVQPLQSSESAFEPLTEEMFDSVPKTIRASVKITDLNIFYRQLFEYFILNNNRTALSVMQMSKMSMKVTDAKIKILKHLSIIELNKKGHIRLSRLTE